MTGFLYLACTLSLLAGGRPGAIAIFCGADAVLLSALLLRPARAWWRPVVACMAAVFIANLATGRGAVLAILFAVGNMTSPVAAAALLRRSAGADARRTDSPASVARFVLLAGLLAPALGACVGGLLVHRAFAVPLRLAWTEWFAAEAAGILLGTPLLLTLWRARPSRWFRDVNRRRVGLAAILLPATAATSLLAFHGGFAPLLFLPSLIVIVTAFCIGRAGAAAAVLIVALTGALYVGQPGQLALVAGDPIVQVLFLQGYLAVVLLTALPVAASLEEGQRLQRALADSETRYRAMAENSADLIAWVDPEGFCHYASPASRDLFGVPPEEMVGMQLGTMIHPDDIALARQHHAEMLASGGETRTIVYRCYHRDGRLIWMEARNRAIFDAERRTIGVQWTIRDVTAHKSVEAMLSEAANSDPLTGLANRRAFFSLLDIAITRARAGGTPLCVAIIDLDHFKRINDAWGHEIGDDALRSVARECQKTIRQDDLLARLGGEEFALAMPATDIDAGVRICERLRATVAALALTVPGGEIVRISLSGGLATLGPGDDATGLVRAADRALYAAKREGRNRIQIAARDTDAAIADPAPE